VCCIDILDHSSPVPPDAPHGAQLPVALADNRTVNRLLALIRRLLHDDDALARYRDRIAIQLCMLAALLLLPFVASNIVLGRLALAAVVAAAVAMLLLNVWFMQRLGRPPLPWAITAVGLCGTVCVAIALNGLNSLPWVYPMLFVTYFVVERRWAHPISLALLGVVSILLLANFGARVMAPVTAALLLTIFMINVVLNVLTEQQRALVEQAITDPLTGAFNRRHLQSQLEAVVSGADLVDRTHAIIAIDVDHFKSINDLHGHACGDEVLRRLVAVIERRKRRSDLLFRTGGEEFALLLPDTTIEEAKHLADALRALVEGADLLAGHTVTVSIGVSVQSPGQPAELGFQRADQALYEAKRTGRNRVVLAG